MGLETPVRGGIEACGCECTLDTELILLRLHIVCHFLQLIEAVQLRDIADLRTIECDVVIEDLLIIDDAVGLDNVCDTLYDAVCVLQSEILILEILEYIGILEIHAVVIPCCETDRTVYLEHGRCLGLRHLGLQCLLIGSGRCGLYMNLYTCLLGILLCEVYPLICLLRLEVEVVNLTTACCLLCWCGCLGCCLGCCLGLRCLRRSCRRARGVRTTTTCQRCHCHRSGQTQCCETSHLLHNISSLPFGQARSRAHRCLDYDVCHLSSSARSSLKHFVQIDQVIRSRVLRYVSVNVTGNVSDNIYLTLFTK